MITLAGIVSGAASTNPNDYVVYEDFEGGSINTTYWNSENSNMAHTSIRAYSGSKSLQPTAGTDADLRHTGTDGEYEDVCFSIEMYDLGTTTNPRSMFSPNNYGGDEVVYIGVNNGESSSKYVYASGGGYTDSGVNRVTNNWVEFIVCINSVTDSTEIYIDRELVNNYTGWTNPTMESTTLDGSYSGGTSLGYQFDLLRIWNGTLADEPQAPTLTTVPVVALISPADDTATTDQTPTLTFNYTGNSTSANCTLLINNSRYGENAAVSNNTNTGITANASLSFETYYWNVTCTDRFGTGNSTPSRNITIKNSIPTKPTISAPTERQQIQSTSVTFVYNSTDASGGNNITYYIIINGTLNVTDTSGTGTQTITGFSNGTNYGVEIVAWDGYDNSTISEQRNFSINLSEFVVSLISPAVNYTSNNPNVTFTFNATSANSISNCSLYIDGIINQTSLFWCEQEFTNVSTACGGLNTGYYSWSGTWQTNPPATTYDGLWNTGVKCDTLHGDCYLYSTYRKTSLLGLPIWEVGAAQSQVATTGDNLSIPQSCWDYNETFLFLRGWSINQGGPANDYVRWHCLDSTGWNLLFDDNGNDYLIEEKIWWSGTTFKVNNIPEGEHNWSVQCFDSAGENSTSSVRDFFVDFSNPAITTDYVNQSIYLERDITGQFNFSDNIAIHSVTITVDDNYVLFNQTGIGATFFQVNISNSSTIYSTGSHNLTVRVADGHTAKELKDAGAFNPTNGIWNNELTYRIRKPYPTNNLKVYQKDKSLFDDWQVIEKIDRFTEIYKPRKPSSTQTFVVESDKEIHIIRNKGHYGGVWLVTGEQWKDFVLENEPNAKVDIKQINDYKVEVTVSGIKNTKELRFNSVGDLNIVTQVYNFTTINVSETYTQFIYNNFETRLTLFAPGLPAPNAIPVWITWNNTLYPITTAGTITNATYPNGLAFFQFDITPNLTFTGNSVEVLHNWTLNLLGVYETTTQQSQEILNIAVGPCGGLLNYTILNMSYFDEVDDSSINLTNAYNLVITDGTYYYNQTGFFTGNRSNKLCTNINPGNTTYNFDMWGSITLSKTGYITKVLNLNPATPIQLSNNPYTNMSLYIIGVANSTTVIYNWFTNDFFVIDGTMRIYRCEPDSSRTLIDSLTVVSGTISTNIQLLTESYVYDITVNGVTYTDPTGFSQCHVESQTDITYFVDIGIDISQITGLAASECVLTLVTNTTVFMQWAANVNNEDPVEGCLQAYRKSIAGNVEVFNNCTTSPPFNRTVIIAPGSNEYVIIGSMKQGNSSVFCENDLVINPTSDATELYGLVGVMAVLFLVAAMTFMFAENGTIRIVASIVGLLSVMYLGLLNITWGTVGSIITLLVIIIAIARYSRKN